jgi:uncharacterized membrane protein YdfJ with MMPL/SSD domain
MAYLDQITSTRPRIVILAWLGVLVLAMPFASHPSPHLIAGGYAASGSQSSHAEAILRREFPGASRPTLAVLLWPRGHAGTEVFTAAIKRVERAVRSTAGVVLPTQVRETASFASGLGEPVVMELRVGAREDRTQEIAETLQQKLNLDTNVQPGGVEIHLLGEGALRAGLAATSKRQLAHAELIGFPLVLLILVFIFGSLGAALLPVVLGITIVVITGAAIYALSLMFSLSIFITNTASLLGIGVAVDYSLIIVARVRQELGSGNDLRAAQSTALRTSGTTVIFSGATVIASLAGLSIIPNLMLRSMALGAILAVFVSVVASVTLLPSLITLIGARRLQADWFAHRRKRGHQNFWSAWTRGGYRAHNVHSCYPHAHEYSSTTAAKL